MAKPHRRFELENKVKQLTRKLARKDEVIAEVVEHNICGTFYYLCSILDGFSRYIVHWDIGESMTEADVEIILAAREAKLAPAREARRAVRKAS
jgi:transposase InsO family protein